MSLDIHITTLPHTAQRYNTTGDYYPRGDTRRWQFCISEMPSFDHEMLVLIHELVEWWWAQRHGILNGTIDRFDLEFEEGKRRGEEDADAEPGDDPLCPVYTGHQFASGIERLCAAMLGIDWLQYEAVFDRLPTWKKQP